MLSIALALFIYIEASNRVIELRLAIPHVQKQLREIQADNDRLQYEIDRFESPLHLMELARKPEFSHLKPPYFKDVWQIDGTPSP
jgi:hypothetical protein